jgi:hypothetical protein
VQGFTWKSGDTSGVVFGFGTRLAVPVRPGTWAVPSPRKETRRLALIPPAEDSQAAGAAHATFEELGTGDIGKQRSPSLPDPFVWLLESIDKRAMPELDHRHGPDWIAVIIAPSPVCLHCE